MNFPVINSFLHGSLLAVLVCAAGFTNPADARQGKGHGSGHGGGQGMGSHAGGNAGYHGSHGSHGNWGGGAAYGRGFPGGAIYLGGWGGGISFGNFYGGGGYPFRSGVYGNRYIAPNFYGYPYGGYGLRIYSNYGYSSYGYVPPAVDGSYPYYGGSSFYSPPTAYGLPVYSPDVAGGAIPNFVPDAQLPQIDNPLLNQLTVQPMASPDVAGDLRPGMVLPDGSRVVAVEPIDPDSQRHESAKPVVESPLENSLLELELESQP